MPSLLTSVAPGFTAPMPLPLHFTESRQSTEHATAVAQNLGGLVTADMAPKRTPAELTTILAANQIASNKVMSQGWDKR
jgi:hypothetical protein